MGLLARVGSVPGILFSFAVSFIVYLCSLPSLPATVAILVAAPINYAVSQAIFTHWIVEKIDEVVGYYIIIDLRYLTLSSIRRFGRTTWRSLSS